MRKFEFVRAGKSPLWNPTVKKGRDIICGSTKFSKEFREIEAILTKKGWAVISPVFFEHNVGMVVSKEEAKLLGQIHYKKIDLSDEVFIIDVDGYIGQSTKKEIEYAKSKHKGLRYYSKEATS